MAGHRRILVIMAGLAVLGTILLVFFVSIDVAVGFLLGSVLAFINYLWMKRSLSRIFETAIEGQRPRFVGAGYFIRYLILGLFIASIYLSGLLPILPLIFGMALFGFAVTIEGFIGVFSHTFSKREI
ncbi:MAG: ATP synthase subunit I [Acidobacteria bacterium]|nr:ATP synthase subunit I [Acidobacteriota bacterium]